MVSSSAGSQPRVQVLGVLLTSRLCDLKACYLTSLGCSFSFGQMQVIEHHRMAEKIQGQGHVSSESGL